MKKNWTGYPDRVSEEIGFSLEKLQGSAPDEVLEAAREYVNSQRFLKRLRDGNELSGTFLSPLGRRIHTSVTAHKYSLQGMCTCDTTHFCRHMAAMTLTWLDHPETFLDLESLLDDLPNRPKEELVGMLRRMLGGFPSSGLEALGVPGFEPAVILEGEDGMDTFMEELEDLDRVSFADGRKHTDEDNEDDEDEWGFGDDDPESGPGTPLN